MLGLLFLAALPVVQPLPNQPLQHVDLQRYMGQWHEIAHMPHFFQRKCTDNVTATYSMQEDGRVRVHNQCREKSGKIASVVGQARQKGERQGALEVLFAPKILSFIPMIWGDYWILEVDEEYQWAVVGGPKQNLLWILSRTPQMNESTFDTLTERARRRGYDTSKLIQMSPIVADVEASED